MNLKELLEQEIVTENVEIYVGCEDYGYGPYLDNKHLVGKILRQFVGQSVTVMQALDFEAKTGVDILDREVESICGAGKGKLAIALK